MATRVSADLAAAVRVTADRICRLVVLVVAGLDGIVAAGGAGVSTTIIGGAPAQRAVLREILAGLGSMHIPELRVVRIAGAVELEAQVEAIRPTWEALVVGGAFLDAPRNWGCRGCWR